MQPKNEPAWMSKVPAHAKVPLSERGCPKYTESPLTVMEAGRHWIWSKMHRARYGRLLGKGKRLAIQPGL